MTQAEAEASDTMQGEVEDGERTGNEDPNFLSQLSHLEKCTEPFFLVFFNIHLNL